MIYLGVGEGDEVRRKVRNLTAPADATTWVVNNKTTTTRLTGENGLTVATYVTKYAVYKDEKIHTTVFQG